MASEIISVIVPTYNKAAVLTQTLRGLSQQQGLDVEWEIIIVDDGSTDNTATVLWDNAGSVNFQLLTQVNRGAGAARNLGAARARGSILLFLDADIVPSPTLVAVHVREQMSRPAEKLVQGRVRQWQAARRPISYDVFAGSFDFGPEERQLPFRCGITQNLSIRRDRFARLSGFDETLRRGEDIEFAYRASKAGLQLRYQPQALAYHNHPLTFSELCSATRRDHRQLIPLLQQYPEILTDLGYLEDKWPVRWARDEPSMIMRKLARQLLAMTPFRVSLRGWVQLVERYWPSASIMDSLV